MTTQQVPSAGLLATAVSRLSGRRSPMLAALTSMKAVVEEAIRREAP